MNTMNTKVPPFLNFALLNWNLMSLERSIPAQMNQKHNSDAFDSTWKSSPLASQPVSLSASEVELSEDCIMIESQDSENKSLENSPPFPSNDFLSLCFFCSKKLDEGKDIYMYVGEKAFSSRSFCNQVILMDEKSEMENSTTTSCDFPSSPSFHEDLFLDGMVVVS